MHRVCLLYFNRTSAKVVVNMKGLNCECMKFSLFFHVSIWLQFAICLPISFINWKPIVPTGQPFPTVLVFSMNLNFIAGGDFPNLNIDPSVHTSFRHRFCVFKYVHKKAYSCRNRVCADTNLSFLMRLLNTNTKMHIPAGKEYVPT